MQFHQFTPLLLAANPLTHLAMR